MSAPRKVILISSIRRVFGRAPPLSPWDSPKPVREELFSLARLEEHARSLALAQRVALKPIKGYPLAGRLADNAAALLDAYRASHARVLIIELFPFGRRQMRFELLPLLDAAKGNALVVCSVRDLIQPRPAREDEMLECFEHYFDRLLVHGDPRLATFERSFGKAARLAGKLHYTGYVVQETGEQGDAGAGEVLVSAGGGAVGRRLLETAVAARALSRLKDRPWRVLAGLNAEDTGGLEGEGVIAGRGAVINARVGLGRVVLIGFRPQWRGQPFGTFRVLFNAPLYRNGDAR